MSEDPDLPGTEIPAGLRTWAHAGRAAGRDLREGGKPRELARCRYMCTLLPMSRQRRAKRSRRPDTSADVLAVERVQTGVRIEKRLLKVLKALADYHDLTLGDLLEGIVLHAFEGKAPFSQDSLRRIAELKRVFNLDLDASASHRLREQSE